MNNINAVVEVLARNALSIDDRNYICSENLLALKTAGLFGRSIDFDDINHRQELITTLAKACTATAFFWGQHMAATNHLLSTDNSLLKHKYLTALLEGDILGGVCYAGLPFNGSSLKMSKGSDDYIIIDGVAPYITGWETFDVFTVWGYDSARKENICVLVERDRLTEAISERLNLVYGNSTNTFKTTWKNFHISTEFIVETVPAPAHQPVKTLFLVAGFIIAQIMNLLEIVDDQLLIKTIGDYAELRKKLYVSLEKNDYGMAVSVRKQLNAMLFALIEKMVCEQKTHVLNPDSREYLLIKQAIFSIKSTGNKDINIIDHVK